MADATWDDGVVAAPFALLASGAPGSALTTGLV
jgi:hypothetical protein